MLRRLWNERCRLRCGGKLVGVCLLRMLWIVRQEEGKRERVATACYHAGC